MCRWPLRAPILWPVTTSSSLLGKSQSQLSLFLFLRIDSSLDLMKNTFHLQYKHSGTFANIKLYWKCDPIIVQSWKCDPIQRHIPGENGRTGERRQRVLPSPLSLRASSLVRQNFPPNPQQVNLGLFPLSKCLGHCLVPIISLARFSLVSLGLSCVRVRQSLVSLGEVCGWGSLGQAFQGAQLLLDLYKARSRIGSR